MPDGVPSDREEGPPAPVAPPPGMPGPPAPPDVAPSAQGPAMPPRPGRSAGEDRDDDDADEGRRWPWLLGGLAVLALAAGVLTITILSGSPPEVEPPPPALIDAAQAEPATMVSLRQTGFVRPLESVQLSAEIAGRITDVSDRLRRGGFVEEGEVLVHLETRQLQADVGRAEAAIARAEAALAEARVERDRQTQLEAREFASEAALQQAIVAVASAEAQLTGARADLVAARSRLDDATITAPFDALVLEENADRGDLAQPGTSLAQLVASEAVEVEFGLTPADLDLLGDAERAMGGRVLIHPVAGTARSPEGDPLAAGVVVDVGPRVEAGSRTVPLIVRVEDPFEVRDGGRPLRIDELVELELPISLANRAAVQVPARAIKGGDTVWAVRDEAEVATLVRVQVTVLQRGDDAVVVEGKLPEGTLVMLSDLPGAADGVQVRLARAQANDAAQSGGEGE